LRRVLPGLASTREKERRGREKREEGERRSKGEEVQGGNPVDVKATGSVRKSRGEREREREGFEARPSGLKRTACRVGLPFREEATAVCIARRARRERGHSPHARWKKALDEESRKENNEGRIGKKM